MTAVTGDVGVNVRFYVNTLGLRLVKKTVNQDDLGAYHLFYADEVGTAGTEVTFFDWPHVPERSHGPGTIRRTLLRIPDSETTVSWWEQHLTDAGVEVERVEYPGGRDALLFSDPEGQQLALVADPYRGESSPWKDGPVPSEHAVRGLLGAEIHSASAANSVLFLEQYLGIREATGLPQSENRRIFRTESNVSVAELHIVSDGTGTFGRVGIGGVHHIALRVENDAEQRDWLDYLNNRGVPNSGLVDRHYFQSLYFREPGGILFEVATAGPGFLGDEDVEHLGERLSLPPFLEPRREEIEAGLKPLPDS